MLPRANCIPKPARLYRTVILGEWNQRHAGMCIQSDQISVHEKAEPYKYRVQAPEAWPTEESYKAGAILHRKRCLGRYLVRKGLADH